jgi:acyl-CoA thioesterase
VAAYTELLSAIVRMPDGGTETTIPDQWMQGRTTYGGLTAALCLDAALAISGGLPLRAVQIAFVGPAGGTLTSTPTLLREGKNSRFVSVRMRAVDGVAAEAIFVFGAARESQLDFSALTPPEVAGPLQTPDYFPRGAGPAFIQNFDVQLAAGAPPMSGAAEADISLWLRHRDRAAPDNTVSLLALADAPPPAAMSMLRQPARISSMTWMAEFLTDTIDTEDGWFLARHTAQTAQQGYSSQAMRLWNRHGRPMMIGRQTIAVFG